MWMHFKTYLIIYSKINLSSIEKERKPSNIVHPEILEMRFMTRYFDCQKEVS